MVSVTQRATNEIDYGGPNGGQLFPWRAMCSQDDCQYSGVHYTETQAEWAIRSHPCPTITSERQVKFMSIAERLWVELDTVVDQLMALSTAAKLAESEDEIPKLKGRATGLAFSLLHMCQPYYADETAISRESMKRYKIRTNQLDWEPTPGFKYDPPIPGIAPRGTATYTQAHNSTGAKQAAPNAVEAGIKRLKAGAAEQIRHAMSTEPPMFSKEDLARVYNTTVAVIEAVAKGA